MFDSTWKMQAKVSVFRKKCVIFLLDRVAESNEMGRGMGQSDFRRNSRCSDEIFVLKKTVG